MEKQESIDTLRDRIASGERDLDETDADALLDFSDTLLLRQSETGGHRHLKLLRHCTRMAEHVGGLAATLDDREAAEAIVRWIHREYDNPETNRDYRVALKQFGRYCSDENGDEPTDSIAWVSSSTPKNYNPMPDPSKMISKDEAIEMADSCFNARDAAMIMVAWDAGPRSGEFRALTVGDVTDHHHGLQITVDGKKGQRSVLLIPSVPYLQRWLDAHPDTTDPDAPLWGKLQTAEEMSYKMFEKAFKSAAERANIAQPATLTNFRKSSASYLASQNLNQAHIEDHHGWVRGSNVAARYVAVFAPEAERELAKAHGVDVSEDEPEPTAPVTCPRCEKATPRDRDFCIHCQQALDFETKALLDRVSESLDEEAVAADDPDDRRDLIRARRTIHEQPNVMERDELHELASSLGSDD